MMDRKIYNDDFEDLIRQKTDQYKMYPSDKVWKEVYGSLHARRRRFVLGMSILIVGILVIAGKEILTPAKNNPTAKIIGKSTPSNSTGANATELSNSSNNSPMVFSMPANPEPGRLNNPDKPISADRIPEDELTFSVTTADATPDHILVPASVLYNRQARPVAVESYAKAEDKQIVLYGSPDLGISMLDPAKMETNNATNPQLSATEPAPSGAISHTPEALATNNAATEALLKEQNARIQNSKDELARQSVQRSTMRAADGSLPESAGVLPSVPASQVRSDLEKANKAATLFNSNSEEGDRQQINWLADNAIQHLDPVKQHRLSWEAYLSPTINYRNLSGGDYTNVKSTVQNVPMSLFHFGNVNDFVDHSPALGAEAGGSIVYHLTRNLSVKGGLQFNYSRYLIRAYSSGSEPATISLNSLYGYLSDSVTSSSTLRNFGGKSVQILQNQYFQLSAPVGIELRVIGNGKLQLGIAGTIQPTYLFNRNNYLLSTDYTSYIKAPSLFRSWNLNAGIEAYISYQVGPMRFQLGPQFRYQLFSTYSTDYPLRENLVEYGIKLGISKSIH